MHKDVKDELTLTNCLPGKGLVLTLWCDNPKAIEKFKQKCYENLGREVNWFHQCDCETYQMFEFWIQPDKLSLVRESAKKVADEMRLKLHDRVEMEKFRHPA